MNDSRIVNISELKAFLTSSKKMVLKMETIDEKYKLDKLPSPIFPGEEEVLLNYQKGEIRVVIDWQRK